MVAGSDDVSAVRKVISELANSNLSDARSTDMVTYWVSMGIYQWDTWHTRGAWMHQRDQRSVKYTRGV